MLRIWVDGCANVPLNLGRVERNVMVRAVEVPPKNNDKSGAIPATYSFLNGDQDEQGDVEFDGGQYFQTPVRPKWAIRFDVQDAGLAWTNVIGFAEIEVSDLARERTWRLMLQEPVSHDAVYGTDPTSRPSRRQPDDPIESPEVRRPAFILVRAELLDVAAGGQQVTPKAPVETRPTIGDGSRRPKNTQRRRVLMITRGTRGDVQPFVALARGLISQYQCEVTIATELVWKSFIKDARVGLPDGTLNFRPSGGNTMSQLQKRTSQMATWQGQHHDTIQTLVFSNTETNFFPSEGAIFHWAYEEDPDFMVFSFTFTHLAMIVSEALRIPIVGFILQPDRQIEARGDVVTVWDEIKKPVRQIINSSAWNAVLSQLMEATGGTGAIRLNKLRASRGLARLPPDIQDTMVQYEELDDQGVPLIAPISPVVVQEHLEDLDDLNFTDFIFLRLGDDALDPQVVSFIDRARASRRSVVGMTFSSMPVGEHMMLSIAVEVCKTCRPRGDGQNDQQPPALIVFAGGQEHDPPKPKLQEEVNQLVANGQLLVLHKGQPFGTLFPKIDAIIGQGGLGVTSEALRAGIPVITSGILLLDQRWWAARVQELGCGSQGLRFERLMHKDPDGRVRIVGLLEKALDTRSSATDSWQNCARKVQRELRARQLPGDEDGIAVNAREVFAGGVTHPAVISNAYEDRRGCGRACCRQARCCCRCVDSAARWLLFLGLPTLFFCWLQSMNALLCCGLCARCCTRRRKSRSDESKDLELRGYSNSEEESDSEYGE